MYTDILPFYQAWGICLQYHHQYLNSMRKNNVFNFYICFSQSTFRISGEKISETAELSHLQEGLKGCYSSVSPVPQRREKY